MNPSIPSNGDNDDWNMNYAKAAAAFSRAVCAARPSLRAQDSAKRQRYIQDLSDCTAEEVVAEVGGTIVQQRDIFKTHAWYSAERALVAVEGEKP